MSSCFAYDVHTFDRTLSMSETAFCSKPVARPPPLVASFADNVSDYVLAGQTNIGDSKSGVFALLYRWFWTTYAAAKDIASQRPNVFHGSHQPNLLTPGRSTRRMAE